MVNSSKILIILPLLAFIALVVAIVNGIPYLNIESLNMDFNFCCALTLIALLMPLNIILEAMKLLTGRSEDSSLSDSMIKTCQGFYLQFLLPLGLGAIAGRSWNVDDQYKRIQIEASLLGGMFQSLSNLLGLFFLFLIPTIVTNAYVARIPTLNDFGIIAILGIFGFVLLALYFFKNWFTWEIWKNFNPLKFMRAGRSVWNIKRLGLLFVYSFLRYVIYLLQWVTVLIWIGQLPFLYALTASIIYLAVVTFVVLPPALSLLSRSGIACAVFGVMGMEASLAMSLCWLIFLLNNGVPAILGSFFMLREIRWHTKL
ncbi:MAG: hypothetical protein IPM92_12800 [Saprospiraceae bacterium]|nr:hypothetical protein [Saprospiraceae bacterium]